jgi:hypothetical protein
MARLMQRTGWSGILDWRRWAPLAAVACALLAAGQVSTRATLAPSSPAVRLPSKAAQPAQFVPQGWVLEQQKVADLNGDGLDDALLLMRRSGGGGAPERILAVVLRQPGGKPGYVLAEMNRRLVPHSDDASLEDPMAEGALTAQRGGFDVKLSLLAGAGSYQMANVQYHFRYQDGCFRLIGYDRMGTNRATLESHDLSVNFLTGEVVHRTGSEQSDAIQERHDKLKSNPRLCFGALDSAQVFNPQ